MRALAAAFTLLENLIALAVLSIGLLGSAAIFSETLRQLHANSRQRAAVALGEELADLLIAAENQGIRGKSRVCTVTRQTCFADPESERWLHEWHLRLRQQLPHASAVLRVAAGTASSEIIAHIEWTDRFGAQRRYSIEFSLRA